MTNERATDRDEPSHSYGPTHGVTGGWVGIVLCVVIAVMALWQEPNIDGVRVALGVVLVGWLLYLMMLRPRIILRPDRITLRGAFAERTIALSSVSNVLVGAYVKIITDKKKYTSSAVGQQRPKRSLALSVPKGPPAPTEADAFQVDVDRLLDTWRDRHDQAPSSLRWFPRELTITVALIAAFVISLLVG